MAAAKDTKGPEEADPRVAVTVAPGRTVQEHAVEGTHSFLVSYGPGDTLLVQPKEADRLLALGFVTKDAVPAGPRPVGATVTAQEGPGVTAG